jgi:hypothetical protein
MELIQMSDVPDDSNRQGGNSPNSDKYSAWDFEYDLYYPGSGGKNAKSPETVSREIHDIQIAEETENLPILERKEAVSLEKSLAELSSDPSVRICGVYAIECINTNRCYVGSSIDVLRRRTQHLKQLNAGTHHAKKLQREFRQHGRAAFKFRLLELVEDIDLLRIREQEWINSTKAFSNGLNSAATASGPEPTAARRLVTLVRSTASGYLSEPPVPPSKDEVEAYQRALKEFIRAKRIKWLVRAAGILGLVYCGLLKAAFIVALAIPLGLLFLITAIGEPPEPPRYRKVSSLRKAAEFVAHIMVKNGWKGSHQEAFDHIVGTLVWERKLYLSGKHFAARNAGYLRHESRIHRSEAAREYVEELLADKFVDDPA